MGDDVSGFYCCGRRALESGDYEQATIGLNKAAAVHDQIKTRHLLYRALAALGR